MSTRLIVAAVVIALSSAGASSAAAYTARHVFVTNRGGNDVVELDESLTLVRTWFAAESLGAPNGMAFTPAGEIWIADTMNNRILAFDSAGTRTLTIDVTVRLGSWVESLYFAGDGTLHASANPGNGTVARYTITGGTLPDVVSGAAFVNLANVNLTASGRVLVSDFSGAFRGLRELDGTTGAVLRTFGTDLMRQEDVMIDAADRVFVSHYEGDEIVVYDAERAEMFRFTTPASETVPLDAPTGIVLTWDCRILVAGFVSNRIYEWHHEGEDVPTYVGSVAVAGVTVPESLAIAGLALPGSFDEFADRVPSCDEPVVPPDAGTTTGDAGNDAGRDASLVGDGGGETRDSGTRSPAASTPGCACGTAPAPHAPAFLPAVALVWLVRRHRAPRHRTISSGRAL